MHAQVAAGAASPADIIAYSTGLWISVLLFALTLRAAKLPGSPLANIGFALCAILWNVGGLLRAGMLAAGLDSHQALPMAAQAAQFSGAALFPIPILSIWRPFARREWQRKASRILWIAACISTATVFGFLWARAFWGPAVVSLSQVHNMMAFNASIALLAGAMICLRREFVPRPVYLPSLTMAVAAGGAGLAFFLAIHLPHWHASNWLIGIGAHLLLILALCSFLLFARFRYADVFIRYGVRIVLAGTWAGLLVYTVQSMVFMPMLQHLPNHAGAHAVALAILANVLLFSFTFLDERISGWMIRWLFRAPDYRASLRQSASELSAVQTEAEVAAAAERAAREPLELSGARIVTVDPSPAGGWPVGLLEGETVELAPGDARRPELPLEAVEILIPISTAGRVTHVLLIAPGPLRPGLVTRDLNYLRTVAAQCGSRLDGLRREREAAERRSHEAVLLQQVTEAELSALRAQVNPHFLFNSLNTVADLIVRDPARAEAMTLRLAGVFRHVLAHSDRPLTSVREEMEFLRTYLYIEEARFGDRLQVVMEVAPEAAGEQIPSLILQPLVENALKHGLGPKPGPGHLWISARAEADGIRLVVEDDGLGPGARRAGPESQGVGLSNIAARLQTLYQDRASLVLEPRPGGGSRATIVLPGSRGGEI